MGSYVRRFVLFAGSNEVTLGGWNDLVGSYKSRDLALAAAATYDIGGAEWAQIVDVLTSEVSVLTLADIEPFRVTSE